jgi:hypothetical protein
MKNAIAGLTGMDNPTMPEITGDGGVNTGSTVRMMGVSRLTPPYGVIVRPPAWMGRLAINADPGNTRLASCR